MCYLPQLGEAGLRELGQNAIAVAGRPAAVLGPTGSRAWRRWDELADIFALPVDSEWAADRSFVAGSPVDPWTRQ